MYRYSGFMLFGVIMFYKGAANTQSVKTAAPKGNTRLGSYEALVTTFSSADQYRILFYVCFCLKTSHLIYTVDSFTVNSRPTVLHGAALFFPLRHIKPSRTWEHQPASRLGGTLDSRITQKGKKCKKHGNK